MVLCESPVRGFFSHDEPSECNHRGLQAKRHMLLDQANLQRLPHERHLRQSIQLQLGRLATWATLAAAAQPPTPQTNGTCHAPKPGRQVSGRHPGRVLHEQRRRQRRKLVAHLSGRQSLVPQPGAVPFSHQSNGRARWLAQLKWRVLAPNTLSPWGRRLPAVRAPGQQLEAAER